MKPDGIIHDNGLKAEFRLIRWHEVNRHIARVDTAIGEAWVDESKLTWEIEPPEKQKP